MPHFVPPSASASHRRPLIVFLHGLGSSGKMAFDMLNLERLGRRYEVHVVAPDGAIDSAGRRFWNAHPACCDFDSTRVNHVAVLDRLISDAVRDFYVDEKRVFVMGFSNGGFMAHRLACELGDKIAGIVSAAGAGPDPQIACRSAKHMRVLEIHGDADETVKYAGGALFGRPNAAYGSAKETIANWAKRLECQTAPVKGPAIDLLPAIAGKETETLEYADCQHGVASLWTVHRGTHFLSNDFGVIESAWRYVARE